MSKEKNLNKEDAKKLEEAEFEAELKAEEEALAAKLEEEALAAKKSASKKGPTVSVKNDSKITHLVAGVTIAAGKTVDIDSKRFAAFSRSAFGSIMLKRKQLTAKQNAVEGCQDALALFKGSIYYVYFKDLPDDLIEAALTEAECLPGAAFMMKSCPKVYCKWLIATAQQILLDLVDSVVSVDDDGGDLDEPVINVNSSCAAPNTYLKKRKILDIECEWAEVKSCLDCDKDTRAKVKKIANDWLKKCKSACITHGFGLVPVCIQECYTCEGGKINRLGERGGR